LLLPKLAKLGTILPVAINWSTEVMMELYSHPVSPYGRKVNIAAAIKGVKDKLKLRNVDTGKGDATLNKQNPLGKIPCLVTEGGEAIFDSHVICEFLDSIGSGPALIPKGGSERWKALTLGAFSDGILDAALLLVYERRFRPEEKIVQSWVGRQQSKIDRAIEHLEGAPPPWNGSPNYGHLTLACALGYLDFRHEGRWRVGHPGLVAWLEQFATVVPSFDETRPTA
jgi:glutathione S-transferase